MKNTLFAALGALTLMTGAAVAQTGTVLQAEIPFAFRAGNVMLPPGNYSIHPEVSSGVLSLRCAECDKGALIVTGKRYAGQPAQKATLVFNRYGDAYYLATVWTPGYVTGRELPKTKAEKESARLVSTEPVTVAARTR